MTAFSFRDLEDLADAESRLIAGCLDHESALLAAMGLAPYRLRSFKAADLERLLFVLIAWHDRGEYDEATNRERLAALLPDDAYWIEEELFDGATAVTGYVAALVSGLRATYEAVDRYLVVRRELDDTPIPIPSFVFSPVAPPVDVRPPQGRQPPKERRYSGGITL